MTSAALPVFLSALFASAAVPGALVGAAPEKTPAALEGVDVIEHLGEKVPLDLPFFDGNGKQAHLSTFLRGDLPVVVNLAYHRCPMLCDLVTNGLLQAARNANLQLGKDYRALTISFDPNERGADMAEKERGYVQALGKPVNEGDWTFLRGNPSSIKPLTEALGFRYRYDAQTGQFAHPAVLFVLTPEGKVSRYLYGVQFSQRDFGLALAEAAKGKSGISLERLLLTCYQYDPASRKYGFFVSGFLRTGGIVVLAAVSIFLGRAWRRERRGSA